MKHFLSLCLFALIFHALHGPADAGEFQTLAQQNEALFRQLRKVHHLSGQQAADLQRIFAGSGYMGQGNPVITKHPVTTEECEAKLKGQGGSYENLTFVKICGDRYMAPLYNPAVEKPEDARACIDQFEFPNIPCAYPVVWVRAKEAAEICGALGKRLCDAHEWEGACAGSLEEPDYSFHLARDKSPATAIRLMANAHNQKHGPTRSWSYGPEYRTGICAASSQKSSG